GSIPTSASNLSCSRAPSRARTREAHATLARSPGARRLRSALARKPVESTMHKRTIPRRLAAIALAAGITAALPTATLAQPDAVRIGLILPMTGPFASTGRQVEAAAKLYVAQHGNSVAGRRIELVVRDDGGTADVTRRIAQE